MDQWSGVRKRIADIIGRYDTAIWVRAGGTALTALTGFMLRPFLVLYLHDKMEGSILIPMLIVGLQPLVGMIISLWGGGLSDRYGRKPVMLAAQLIQTVSMVGYIFAEDVWHFVCITILNGLGHALFSPAANAQVTDVVPEKQRAEVFALLHTALNVGAAAGPLLGLVLFTQNPSLVFAISAAAMLFYAVILWLKVPETLPSTDQLHQQKVGAPRLVLGQHTPLLWMTALAVPVSLLYAQVETVFPLHLKEQFNNYQTVFAWLLTINGTTVILLQMWLARRTEHLASRKVILFAYAALMVVAVGYGFAPSFALLVLVEMLFTIGEMLFGPHMQKSISLIAPAEMRGRYFSIYGLNWQVSRAVGPVLGGAVFAQFGGEATFTTVALLLMMAGILQYRMIHRIEQKREQSMRVSTVTG